MVRAAGVWERENLGKFVVNDSRFDGLNDLYAQIIQVIEGLQMDLWGEDSDSHADLGFSVSPFVHADTLKEKIRELFFD